MVYQVNVLSFSGGNGVIVSTLEYSTDKSLNKGDTIVVDGKRYRIDMVYDDNTIDVYPV